MIELAHHDDGKKKWQKINKNHKKHLTKDVNYCKL